MRLNDELKTIDDQIRNYHFSEAYDRLYHLIWDDVADWYIEASKAELNPGLLKWFSRRSSPWRTPLHRL